MRKLLNTLYITSEDAYLSLDGENIVVSYADGTKKKLPLHTLETIISFSYKGASPALIGKCAENSIQFSFFSPFGKYYASVGGNTNGNVYLRRRQYKVADDEEESVKFAKAFIYGKLYNSRYLLLKFKRDYPMRINTEKIEKANDDIKQLTEKVINSESCNTIRGFEGQAANRYFDVFDELILQNKDYFCFDGRNRRPPRDPVNALLSFSYSLLTNDCAAALHGVGLDPYVGFLHSDRPGRKSLALDLMEELRSVFADRFVTTLINNRIITKSDFDAQGSGAILLNDNGRKRFIKEWQERKRETLTHPFLKEKIYWGLVPHVQAMLLSRCLRGDLDGYPPFFWK